MYSEQTIYYLSVVVMILDLREHGFLPYCHSSTLGLAGNINSDLQLVCL